MKKLLSLTAAALLLITTGCGRSNAPPASASSGTPSVSAPITEPTVESSDDTTPTVQKDEAAAKSIKELKKFGDNVTALMDLSAGRLDALVVDEVVGRYYTSKKPGEYRVLDENFGTEDYGVGTRKDDTELMAKIEKAMDDMKADGSAATISTKWFGKDIVKK